MLIRDAPKSIDVKVHLKVPTARAFAAKSFDSFSQPFVAEKFVRR